MCLASPGSLFTPRVSMSLLASLGKVHLLISSTLSYIYALFWDKTDKKVMCRQAQVEEGEKKWFLEFNAPRRHVLTDLSAFLIEATKMYLLAQWQSLLRD
jgi:hypothetical protein